MNRYLGRSKKFLDRSGDSSKLSLKKTNTAASYDELTNPLLSRSRGMSLLPSPVPKKLKQVRPRNVMESCANTFVTSVEIKKHMMGVVPQSNVTAAAAKVKGSCRVVQRYQNAYKIYSRESHVYHCDFFRLMFFPTDHFLSLFRKSVPALNVRTVGEVFLNGKVESDNDGFGRTVFNKNSQKSGFVKTQDTHRRLNKLFQNNPSNIPKNYAFLRRQLRITVRKSFIKEWCKLHGDAAVKEKTTAVSPYDAKFLDETGRTKPGIAKDGYYMFQVLIFPDKLTKKEFEANVRESIRVVAKLEWDKFLKSHTSKGKENTKTWVQMANDRVRLGSLNKLLESNEVPLSVARG